MQGRKKKEVEIPKKKTPVAEIPDTSSGIINCMDTDTVIPEISETEPPAESPYIYQQYRSRWSNQTEFETTLKSPYVDSILEAKKIQVDYYENGDMYGGYDAINRNEIKKLSAKELLYYCLIHPCMYAQNCNIVIVPNDGKTYITRMLPTGESARFLSKLQCRTLVTFKDSVTPVLVNEIKLLDTVDIDYLHVVADAGLTSAIPALTEKADFKKNPYIYTVFYLLMNEKYKPFMRSRLLKKMQNSDDLAASCGAMELDEKAARELTDFALQFYKSTVK